MASSSIPSSSVLTSAPISFSLGNIINYIYIRLDEYNYPLWRSPFVLILVTNDLQGYVNGSVMPPPPTTKTTEGKEISNPDFLSCCKPEKFVLIWVVSMQLSHKSFSHKSFGTPVLHCSWCLVKRSLNVSRAKSSPIWSFQGDLQSIKKRYIINLRVPQLAKASF